MKRTTLALMGLLALGTGAGSLFAETVATAPAMRLSGGYLTPDKLPDDLALIPAPPTDGSATLRRDRDGEKRAIALFGTARWELAKVDADIFTPAAVTNTMSCAAGLIIGAETTPKTNTLLRRVMSDLGRASTRSKETYKRPRPFVGNGKPICTPDQEGILRGNGSYPSGHASIGYGWGLILADLLPQRRRQLIRRGYAFGDSRRVCNVHFTSDIEAGQTIAIAVVARLQSDPAFQADLAAARAELRGLKVKPAKADCAREAAALRLR